MVDSLGAQLVRKGLLTQIQLDEALKSQLLYGGSLGTNLVELGMLDLATLGQALSDAFHFPVVTEAELAAVSARTVALLRPEFARHHLALPLVLEGRRLRMAMAEPQDPRHVDALAFATGLRIVPSILPEPRLLEALETHYGIVRPVRPARPGQPRPGGLPSPASAKAQPPGMMPRSAAGTVAPRGVPAPLAAPPTPVLPGRDPFMTTPPRTAELFPEEAAPPPSAPAREQTGSSSHEAHAPERDARPSSLPLVELSVEEVIETPLAVDWRNLALELPQAPVGEWELCWDIDYIESDSGSASWAQRGLEVDFSSLAANGADGVPLARVHEFLPRWEARLGRDEGMKAEALLADAVTRGRPPWVQLPEAMEALRRAKTRGQLGQALLSYAQGRFPRSFLLGETFGAIRVGLACGTGSDKPEVAALKVDLSTPSLLAHAASDGGPVVSSTPESRTDEALFAALGGSSSHLVAAPIRLRQRAVGFVVIDGGPAPFGAEELDELERLLAAASEAYGRLHETSF